MGEWREVTRRTVLAQAAASGAATLLSPGLAVARPGSRRIATRLLGVVRGHAAPVSPPRGAVLVGLQWETPRQARLELRVLSAGERWGPWVPASSQGHDADAHLSGGSRFGEPLWIGRTAAVQVRSHGTVGGVRLHFVTSSRQDRAQAGAAYFPPAQPVLDAGPGQPPVIARRAWAQGQAPPAALAGYGTVLLGFVHHTVNPNGYSADEVPGMLRAIFDYHRYVRGFLDIAYNFLIDAYGRIWEGRAGGIDMAVVGAHAGAYNTQSTGVAILGDFTAVVPSAAALGSLKRLLAWKLSLHGIPASGRTTVIVDPADASDTPFAPGAHVSLPRVAGHRDGDLTDCPGDALYARLPTIRRHVVALAGVPARISFQAPKSAVTAGQPVALTGSLAQLDGTPLAGAPVQVQLLNFDAEAARESTQLIETVQTADDGSWSASVTLEHNAILRAIHGAAPACVADWTALEVAPALVLRLTSTAPLALSGTISPAKRKVTVDLYSADRPHQPIASRKASGSQGSFQVSFPTPAPGSYFLVARTPVSKTNAAGASPPAAVTVS